MLLLSIFISGMLAISALSAMQITDVTGKQITLTQEQQDAFMRCGIKHAVSNYAGEHSYEGLELPFMTAGNLENLLQLINDTKHLETINDDTSIELFKLADYLQAPKEILVQLAKRICEPITKYYNQLQEKLKNNPRLKKLQQAVLDYALLKETIELSLPIYPSFASFLKHFPKVGNTQEPDFINKGLLKLTFLARAVFGEEYNLDLSFNKTDEILKTKKSIVSLEGIEKLGEYPWAKKVRLLDLSGHKIESGSVKKLKSTFPSLKFIILKNNEIKQIEDLIDENIEEIRLEGNPIQKISIRNPEQFNKTRIITDNLKEAPLFKQNLKQRIAAWGQSLIAKSKVAIKTSPYALTSLGLCFYVGVFGGASNIAKNTYYYLGYGCSILAGLYLWEEVMSAEMQNLRSNDPYRIQIKSKKSQENTEKVWEYPSPYTYNLFGKN